MKTCYYLEGINDRKGNWVEFCRRTLKKCTCQGVKEECENGYYDDTEYDREEDR
jgi:hypothetical protein